MAFLLPLISEVIAIGAETTLVAGEVAATAGETIAVIGTEAVTAGGEIVTAGGEAIAVSGETITAGAEGTAAAGEGTVAAGESTAAATGEAGSVASKAVPVFDMTASGTTAGAQAAHQAILQGAIAFGKWAAIEAVKAGLFYAGMKALEAIVHVIAQSLKPEQGKALTDKVKNFTDAGTSIKTILTDWLAWGSQAISNKDKFGTVKVGPTTLTRFEIFQSNVGELSDRLNAKVAPLINTYNQSRSSADLEALRLAALDLCKRIKEQSDSIRVNEKAMVSAGLSDHQSDISDAISKLS